MLRIKRWYKILWFFNDILDKFTVFFLIPLYALSNIFVIIMAIRDLILHSNALIKIVLSIILIIVCFFMGIFTICIFLTGILTRKNKAIVLKNNFLIITFCDLKFRKHFMVKTIKKIDLSRILEFHYIAHTGMFTAGMFTLEILYEDEENHKVGTGINIKPREDIINIIYHLNKNYPNIKMDIAIKIDHYIETKPQYTNSI